MAYDAKGLKTTFRPFSSRFVLFFSPHVVSQTEAGVEIRGGRQIAVSEVVPPEAPGSRR